MEGSEYAVSRTPKQQTLDASQMIAYVRGCSLVEQIRRIKEKALGAKDEEQVEYLTSVLDALTTCVSSLHEREHESLINEVLDISIWQATPVSLAQPCFRL